MAAFLVVLMVFSGTLTNIPPFSTVMVWNEKAKTSWIPAATPSPMARGESTGGGGRGMGVGRLTFSQTCESMGIEVQDGLAKLKEAGIDVQPDMTMRTIADQYEISIRDIADLMRKQ